MLVQQASNIDLPPLADEGAQVVTRPRNSIARTDRPVDFGVGPRSTMFLVGCNNPSALDSPILKPGAS